MRKEEMGWASQTVTQSLLLSVIFFIFKVDIIVSPRPAVVKIKEIVHDILLPQ